MRWMDLVFLAIIITAVIVYYMLKQGLEKPGPLRRKDTAALKFLEEKGYSLAGQSVRSGVTMNINEKAHRFRVDAHFSVKKDGRRYLVFLRASEDSDRLNSPALRNRLLLLHSLYSPSGILFVNPESEKIQEVTFSYRRQHPLVNGVTFALVLIILILLFLLLTVGGLL
jgi:hypothetical protein